MNKLDVQFSPPIVLKGRDEPQNVDAEVAVLGGILCDSLAYDRVADTLEPRHFYLSYHGKAFEAMVSLKAENHPIDPVSVMAKLAEMEVPDGNRVVFGLIDQIPSAVNIDYYAELLVKKWRLRETIRLCREAAQMGYEGDATPEGLRIYVQDGLTGLAGDSKRDIIPIADAVGATLDEIAEACETGEQSFTPTGLGPLDEALDGGVRREDLIVVAGRPGMGKSALAINNLLPAIASASDQPSLVFSLEMGHRQLCKRFLALNMSKPWHLKDRNYAQINWEELGRSGQILSALPIFIDDRPAVTLERVAATCRRVKAEKGALGCVVIDYIQIMGGMDDDNTRVRSLGKVANGLKNLARELDTTVIVLSQLNRGVESQTDKRPSMKDLRESGTIEEAADIIMLLYRDEYYNPETDDRGIAEVNLVKHRNGKVGTVKLFFDPTRSKFADPEVVLNTRVEVDEDDDDF